MIRDDEKERRNKGDRNRQQEAYYARPGQQRGGRGDRRDHRDQYAQDMRIAGGARSTPQPGRSGPGYVDAYAHMDQRGYGRDQRDYRDQRQPRAHDRYDQRGMYDMITPKMKPVRHGQPLQDAYSRTPGAPVSQYVSPLPAQAHTAPRAYHSGGRREDKRRR